MDNVSLSQHRRVGLVAVSIVVNIFHCGRSPNITRIGFLIVYFISRYMLAWVLETGDISSPYPGEYVKPLTVLRQVAVPTCRNCRLIELLSEEKGMESAPMFAHTLVHCNPSRADG